MEAMLLLLLLLRIQTSENSQKASLLVSPRRTQFFEYEKIFVSCECFSSSEWKVWRYTNSDRFLSRCGSDWGNPTSSGCELNVVKPSDTGVYWCESRYRDSSNMVNITVTRSLVVLQSPVEPVMEHDDVTLHCKNNHSGPSSADFLKHNNDLVGTSSTGHMTIRNFSKSDEGAYKCRDSKHGESPPTWLLIHDSSSPATLTVRPSSSQVFEFHNLSFSCETSSRSRVWKVVRAIGINSSEERFRLETCGTTWGDPTPHGCLIHTSKKFDSGIYWCESTMSQRSNSVRVNIYNKEVILVGLIHPVGTGENVTLLCKAKIPPPRVTAVFYKNNTIIGSGDSATMTLHHVSQDDEGHYRCQLSGLGNSSSSLLLVRAPQGPPSAALVPHMVIHLVVFCPYCVSTVLVLLLYLSRLKANQPSVSMTTSSAKEDDEQLNRDDDATADGTIEHEF
ncbi:Fc receptor-like protein 5 isoform X1 [Takifugu rubripes]|uniref:Fc receptor-like protein 5 isoform X1 n=1 Tax=Takifugu rubripes TaxID=31033 RepID=UPI0011459C4E|nr:Fc receptor-like protein 5 isoform X1 [Takifugu rubripes]